jgi:hypothetical protein
LIDASDQSLGLFPMIPPLDSTRSVTRRGFVFERQDIEGTVGRAADLIDRAPSTVHVAVTTRRPEPATLSGCS